VERLDGGGLRGNRIAWLKRGGAWLAGGERRREREERKREERKREERKREGARGGARFVGKQSP